MDWGCNRDEGVGQGGCCEDVCSRKIGSGLVLSWIEAGLAGTTLEVAELEEDFETLAILCLAGRCVADGFMPGRRVEGQFETLTVLRFGNWSLWNGHVLVV